MLIRAAATTYSCLKKRGPRNSLRQVAGAAQPSQLLQRCVLSLYWFVAGGWYCASEAAWSWATSAQTCLHARLPGAWVAWVRSPCTRCAPAYVHVPASVYVHVCMPASV